MFATEQCLLVLTHHPAVWHQAAQFLDQSSKALADKGVRILFLCHKISPFQWTILNSDAKNHLLEEMTQQTIFVLQKVWVIKKSINLEIFQSLFSFKTQNKQMDLFIS